MGLVSWLMVEMEALSYEDAEGSEDVTAGPGHFEMGLEGNWKWKRIMGEGNEEVES